MFCTVTMVMPITICGGGCGCLLPILFRVGSPDIHTTLNGTDNHSRVPFKMVPPDSLFQGGNQVSEEGCNSRMNAGANSRRLIPTVATNPWITDLAPLSSGFLRYDSSAVPKANTL